jgi:hypothetical protein
MRRILDHVPFAWSDLDEITAEFDRLGLTSEYGGVHDNGVTHMAVVGFDDRSYIELIAERNDGGRDDDEGSDDSDDGDRDEGNRDADHGFWPEHIRDDAGPAAWCVRIPDIVAECKHVLDAGHPVRGPLYGARERDDGTLVEWDRAEFGTDDQRLLLPFAIEDRTPLSHRVAPSDGLADGPLTGIGQVVVAVDDLDAAAELFRDLYRYPRPVRESVPGVGAVASFPGQPLALATPDGDGCPDDDRPDGDGWLADRLARFPAGPCICLLGTYDLEAAREAYPLGDLVSWPDGRAAFFDSDRLGRRLGVVERDPPA